MRKLVAAGFMALVAGAAWAQDKPLVAAKSA